MSSVASAGTTDLYLSLQLETQAFFQMIMLREVNILWIIQKNPLERD